MKTPFSTCVHPQGYFVYGIHKPSYKVSNQRVHDQNDLLGRAENDTPVLNGDNFPAGDVIVEKGDWVYEVPNPFPFKGVTYINKRWADASADNPARFKLPSKPQVSFSNSLQNEKLDTNLIKKLPRPLKLALATTSTDPDDLIILAKSSCEMLLDESDTPTGLTYKGDGTNRQALIHDFHLFEAVANNPHLPDIYKIVMVIKPGVQGASEITGEWLATDSHIYEYLRTNSYISGGHYAANMSEDAIRYSIKDLSETDITGLRHLYYQRSFIRLAEELGISKPLTGKLLNTEELETLRKTILEKLLSSATTPQSRSTLWGWNFGFDYAPTEYRLHASHQQIHQQYAMIPGNIERHSSSNQDVTNDFHSYACGDLISDTIRRYYEQYKRSYFIDYFNAIESNRRMDDRDDLEDDLVVWSDDNVIVFVPKAQTSQWEVQIMTRPNKQGHFVGNILEADENIRASLDLAILKAQQALAGLGARMVTSIEYSKQLTDKERMQPLIYALLPRLPESPGAFSEAQLRFINGHYPEDFAAACRKSLQ